MANWHLVIAYDNRATEWLTSHGYPHPAARSGNRLPTLAEIDAAFHSLGIPSDAPLLVDGVGIEESFRMRGDLVSELRVLRKLCEHSGQLWVYPDCGSPAIVVDDAIDADKVAATWLDCLNADDSWQDFHEKMYRN